jgi:hypothetical protein
MWIKDPKTNKPSVTLTIMITGFVVALVKLLLSGISYGDFNFAPFSGSDFGAVFGAVGAIYTARKYTDKDKE